MVLWGLGLEASGAVNSAGRANGGTTGVSDSGGVTDVQAISYSGGDLYLWWNNGAADKNCQGYQSASGTTFGAWNLYNSGTCVAASGTGGVLYPTSDLNNACVLYTELVCVDSTGAVYDYSGSAWATDPHSMVVSSYGTGGGGNQCQATDDGTFILCAGLSNGVDNVVVAVSSAPSTVTLPIKITIGASGGTHTNSGFSMSGGSPSPSSSIEANTAGYTTDITINPSTYWTLTAPTANSTSRIEYYNSTSSSATNVYEGESCSSGTCSTVDITFYYQLKSTASYTLSGGGSPTAPTLAYTGFGGTVDYTLTGTGTAEWLDFGSTWSSTNPLTGSNSSTRFDAGSGTGGTATAGATIAPAYYHQEACSCSYSGTVASAPSIDGTAFGSSGASTALTGTPTSVWLDLGGSYTITKPTANFPSATERYETNAANGTVTTHFTLAPAFYQQWKPTIQLTPSLPAIWDGTYSESVTGTQFGTSSTTICTATLTSGMGTGSCAGFEDGSTTESSPGSWSSSIAGSWTATGTHAWSITSASTQTADYDLEDSVTEQVTITAQSPGDTHGVATITGCDASVLTIPMNGVQHSFSADYSCSITFTVPSDNATTRFRFDVASSPSTTFGYTTSVSGTDTKTQTVFYQFIQGAKFSWTCLAGHTCSASPTLDYTTASNAATLSETGTIQDVWADAGSTATITASLTDVQGSIYGTSPTSWSITAANQVGDPSTYGANPVVLSIRATLVSSAGASPATIGVSGCSTNSTSFSGDGAFAHFSVSAVCSSITLTVPTQATTFPVRYFFAVGLNASEVFTTPGSSAPYSFTYRAQDFLTDEGGLTITTLNNGTSTSSSDIGLWSDAGINATVAGASSPAVYTVNSPLYFYQVLPQGFQIALNSTVVGTPYTTGSLSLSFSTSTPVSVRVFVPASVNYNWGQTFFQPTGGDEVPISSTFDVSPSLGYLSGGGGVYIITFTPISSSGGGCGSCSGGSPTSTATGTGSATSTASGNSTSPSSPGSSGGSVGGQLGAAVAGAAGAAAGSLGGALFGAGPIDVKLFDWAILIVLLVLIASAAYGATRKTKKKGSERTFSPSDAPYRADF